VGVPPPDPQAVRLVISRNPLTIFRKTFFMVQLLRDFEF
jgi:hypothetical protein